MSSLMAFIAPLMLAAAAPQAGSTAGPAGLPAPSEQQGEWVIEWSLAAIPVPGFAPVAPQGRGIWSTIAEAFRPDPAEQVRIDQRVIIRITPLAAQREMLADLPRAPLPTRFSERKVGKCLAVSNIAGVQVAGDNRLLLFLRDQRLIGANLEKACKARDFYSGFYVDRSKDGRLCVDRDMIHSRTGTSCSVSKLRHLVAQDD